MWALLALIIVFAACAPECAFAAADGVGAADALESHLQQVVASTEEMQQQQGLADSPASPSPSAERGGALVSGTAPARKSKRIQPAVPVKIWDLEHDAFDRIVRDPARDVFVKFYTPWCKHCVDMEVQFKRLAELLPHVTFGQVNGEVDTQPMHKYKVKELPVLMLFTKDDKSGMKYVGARDVRSMKAFIQTMIEEI
jgi:thiol-disulfide isomerase/thioredoxin